MSDWLTIVSHGIASLTGGGAVGVAAALANARKKRADNEGDAIAALSAQAQSNERRLMRAEQRLDECEGHRDECRDSLRATEARAEEMMRVATRMQRDVDALRREMQRRGMTPPELIPAVPGDEEA